MQKCLRNCGRGKTISDKADQKSVMARFKRATFLHGWEMARLKRAMSILALNT
jgi:hypothetical protein